MERLSCVGFFDNGRVVFNAGMPLAVHLGQGGTCPVVLHSWISTTSRHLITIPSSALGYRARDACDDPLPQILEYRPPPHTFIPTPAIPFDKSITKSNARSLHPKPAPRLDDPCAACVGLVLCGSRGPADAGAGSSSSCGSRHHLTVQDLIDYRMMKDLTLIDARPEGRSVWKMDIPRYLCNLNGGVGLLRPDLVVGGGRGGGADERTT